MATNDGRRTQRNKAVPQSETEAYEYFCRVKEFRRFLVDEESSDEGGRWIVTDTASRQPKPQTTEDSYFAETLATPRTIPHLLTVYWSPSSSEPSRPGWPTITEIKAMAAVGDGVNGYPHISHGGFLATLLDELPGVLVMLNTAQFTPFSTPSSSSPPSQSQLQQNLVASGDVAANDKDGSKASTTLPTNPSVRIIPPTTDMLTASLRVQYLRSVHTPCNLLISVKIMDVVWAPSLPSSSSSTNPLSVSSPSESNEKARVPARRKREKLVYTIQTAASNGMQGAEEVIYARGEAVWVGVPRIDRGGIERGGGDKGKL